MSSVPSSGWKSFWTGPMSRAVKLSLDVIALTAALGIAYFLRFEGASPDPRGWHLFFDDDLSRLVPLVLLVQMGALYAFGIYNFVWRYVGLREVRAFNGAFVSSAVVFVALRLFLPESLAVLRIPFSVIAIDALLAFGFTLGLRVARRTLSESQERETRNRKGSGAGRKRVLLVGAGHAGVLAAREMAGRRDLDVAVVGFVDDADEKKGAVIQGFKVVGTTGDLPALVKRLQIDHVIITIANAARAEIRRIVDTCESIPVKARIITGYYDILQGRISVSAIRDVDIEDLLGREPVRLDVSSVRGIVAGKTVMVTGAGGSIGSELARQAARFSPGHLLLVERSEFALYTIHDEMTRCFPDLSITPLIADIGDSVRIHEIFRTHRPNAVFHAAAHKHVPMMEWNVVEAAKNNVLGTLTLAETAGIFGAEKFILISTDKAVNPTSVMGTTKRAAELVIQTLDSRYETEFMAVRFGNVLGSTGSVVPKFRKQIAEGGPVTVTHPDMRRYFMTIPEACQLVLQAGALGRGGEIFVLDMGEPVRLVDLARDMVRLSGLEPDVDIEIAFTGIRPGEKLFEELSYSSDRMDRPAHPKIFAGRIPTVEPDTVMTAIWELKDTIQYSDDLGVRVALGRFVPEATIVPLGGGRAAEAEPATQAAGDQRRELVDQHTN